MLFPRCFVETKLASEGVLRTASSCTRSHVVKIKSRLNRQLLLRSRRDFKAKKRELTKQSSAQIWKRMKVEEGAKAYSDLRRGIRIRCGRFGVGGD